MKKLLLSAAVVVGIVAISPDLQKELKDRSQQVYWMIMENIRTETNETTSKLGVSKENDNVYYYRSQLSVKDQDTYDQILHGIQNHDPSIKVSDTNTKKVSDITKEVLYDHPELFWVDTQEFKVRTEQSLIGCSNVYMTYPYSAEESKVMQAEIDTAADTILEQVKQQTDTYDKIKAAYDSMIELVDYDIDAPDNQTIYSVFATKKSVCAGYAKSYQYLMQKSGIPCITVFGDTSGDPHAWDIVSLDGTYYYVDPTWGDPVFLNDNGEEVKDVHDIYYDYFLCGSKKIAQTHTADPDIMLPTCSVEDFI